MRALIESMRTSTRLSSPRVVATMVATDRALYVVNKADAYYDSPSPIGHGATISAPHMHAMSLELLQEKLHPGASVLDIGVGSGYLTAAFARMVSPGGRVVGIDRVPELVEMSRENILRDDPELINQGTITLDVVDGWTGYERLGPYDAIHVGAASDGIPEALVRQLKNNGIMVIPVVDSPGSGASSQGFYEVRKDSEGRVTQRRLFSVRYVPLIPDRSEHAQVWTPQEPSDGGEVDEQRSRGRAASGASRKGSSSNEQSGL